MIMNIIACNYQKLPYHPLKDLVEMMIEPNPWRRADINKVLGYRQMAMSNFFLRIRNGWAQRDAQKAMSNQF